MIANAVPSQLSEAIGRVILARENGESIPEIQGRFGQWLRRQYGFNKASIHIHVVSHCPETMSPSMVRTQPLILDAKVISNPLFNPLADFSRSRVLI